mgnify:CR=1 FL=1
MFCLTPFMHISTIIADGSTDLNGMNLSSGDISYMIFKPLVREDLGDFSLDRQSLVVFMELDGKGLVHSQEVWRDGNLVGGFFGICLGSLCFGEYAVESTPGAASLAILQAAAELREKGVDLVDMQKETARTDQLEYQEVSRVAFIDLCRVAASQHETASKSDLS